MHRLGKKINVYKMLVSKPEGKRPLDRPRCRWDYNINSDVREIGYSVHWIHLIQGSMADSRERGNDLRIPFIE